MSLLKITIKTIVTHTVTYFIMGLLALVLLNYEVWFAKPELASIMRQLDDPWVMAGPLLQPIRGILFGVVFYLLRDVLFERRGGWFVMWLMLVFVGILSTFGPAPGSVEGMIYTNLPLSDHILGWPEVMLQALLMSVILVYWVNPPHRRWLNWLMGIAFVLTMLLPAAGLLANQYAVVPR